MIIPVNFDTQQMFKHIGLLVLRRR